MFNGFDFLVCVLKDLVHCLLIVPLHGFYFLLELCDLVFLDLNEVGVVLHFFISLRSVSIVDVRLSLMELSLLFIFLLLQFLVTCGILKHLLCILTSLVFYFFVLLLCQFSYCFFEIIFHLSLCNIKIFIFVMMLKSSRCQVFLQLSNFIFLLILTNFFSNISLVWIFNLLQVIFCCLFLIVVIFHF